MFYALVPTMLAANLVLAGADKDDAAVRKDFNDRVGDYMKVRKKAVQGTPSLKPKSSAEEIHASRKALAQAIQSARSNVAQGTVFTPGVKTYFLKVIRSEMRGK